MLAVDTDTEPVLVQSCHIYCAYTVYPVDNEREYRSSEIPVFPVKFRNKFTVSPTKIMICASIRERSKWHKTYEDVLVYPVTGSSWSIQLRGNFIWQLAWRIISPAFEHYFVVVITGIGLGVVELVERVPTFAPSSYLHKRIRDLM